MKKRNTLALLLALGMLLALLSGCAGANAEDNSKTPDPAPAADSGSKDSAGVSLSANNPETAAPAAAPAAAAETLSDPTFTDESGATYEGTLLREDSGLSKSFRAFDSFTDNTQMPEGYDQYVKDVTGYLTSREFFTNTSLEEASSDSKTIMAYDAEEQIVFSLYCHNSGFQTATYRACVYSKVSEDLDAEINANLDRIKEYTGISWSRTLYDNMAKQVTDTVGSDGYYSVVLEDPNSDDSIRLSVIDFGQDIEMWTLEAIRTVSMGSIAD